MLTLTKEKAEKIKYRSFEDLKNDTKAFQLTSELHIHPVLTSPSSDPLLLSSLYVADIHHYVKCQSSLDFCSIVQVRGISFPDQHLAHCMACGRYNTYVWNVGVQSITRSDLP